MQQRTAITKAEALIEANRYIQRFRDKVVVVKVGGSVQEDEEKLRALLTDISFMSAVGMRPVIVHGGGKSITAAMEKAGLAARFVQGRRYTDRQTLEIVSNVGGHAGHNAREFFHIHSAAVDSKGNLFLGEVNNGQRYYRYVFKGVRSQ